MNKHIKNILIDYNNNSSLLYHILLYVKINKDELDIYDIAEIIKEDKTIMNQLYYECKNNKMLKCQPENILKLTDIL